MKKIYKIILLILVSLLLVSCVEYDNYYSLELPEGVLSNQDEHERIVENTEITLTVLPPTGYILDYLEINDERVDVVSNVYTFNIHKNTVVNVTFKEMVIHFSIDLPEEVISNVEDNLSVLLNTFVTLTVLVPEGMELNYLKINSEQVEVNNLEYKFYINSDIVVTVGFKIIESPTYYSLTLPDFITSDVIDNNQILANTLVTLTINLNSKYKLDSLKLNDYDVDVVNLEYSFVIYENTVVHISYSLIEEISEWEYYSSKDEVAEYISLYNHLPYNYLTSYEVNLFGYSHISEAYDPEYPAILGGDNFYNNEQLLPKATGRSYYVADVNYYGGARNNERIVYSNDGLVFYTTNFLEFAKYNQSLYRWESYQLENEETNDNPLLDYLVEDNNYVLLNDVVLYLIKFQKLPPNYLTKGELSYLGYSHISQYWTSSNLATIGGDTFTNREGYLPSAMGRHYFEADIEYNGYGNRNALRIVYSNDGLIFYTKDHYDNFIEFDTVNLVWYEDRYYGKDYS